MLRTMKNISLIGAEKITLCLTDGQADIWNNRFATKNKIELYKHRTMSQGMLQPNQSMEQFGQTTIDDFRPSISPVIPDVSQLFVAKLLYY